MKPRSLTHLGSKTTAAARKTGDPRSLLEAFPNPKPGRDYTIELIFPEFTSICPVTGQPDFATITIDYVPDESCVEMKSLKLYFQAFRNRGIFYEAIANQILDDLVSMLDPMRMKVEGRFNARGGMVGIITARFEKQKNDPPLSNRKALHN